MTLKQRRLTKMIDTTYNGWTNYETWNVALWLDNEYFYYSIMMMQSVKNFDDFIKKLQSGVFNNLNANWDWANTTGDGVLWTDPKVNIQEINEKIMELKNVV